MSLAKFNPDTHTGKVTEKAFLKGIDEDTFVDLPIADVFTKVDEIREQRLGTAMTEAIDFAEKHGVGTGDSMGVTIEAIPLGGHTVGNVYIDPTFKVVGEINTAFKGDLMAEVLSRSGLLYEKFNAKADAEVDI